MQFRCMWKRAGLLWMWLVVAGTVVPCCAEGTHGAAPANNSSMFDDEFYPTPPEVIRRMLQPWAMDPAKPKLDLAHKRIMDPSAGSGAILKYIAENAYLSRQPECLHAVEINPACRTLLEADPQIGLVGDDFLQFTTDRPYDLIVMNPPFSNGVKHLIHAWQLLTTGDVVCLLNAENIRNPHTMWRKRVVELIDTHGSVEFIGPVFAQAERKTDVEVALVRLAKVDERDRFGFWNDAYFQRERRNVDFDDSTLGNQVAVNDLVGALVGQYRGVEDIFVDYLKAYRRLRYHVAAISTGSHRSFDDMLKDAVRWRDKPEEMVGHFMADLREQAWHSIIVRTKLHDLMTASVRRDFDEMQRSQQAMAFTEENIHALFDLLWQNQYKILQRSVEESFDLMTKYHKQNRVHVEGWLSNDAFKVGPKVVLPGCVSLSFMGGMEVNHYHEKSLNDIDRGVAMVAGQRLGQITSITAALYDRFKGMKVHSGPLEDNTCESTYFHIRYFKKGTIHLTWLDDQLRERFNIAAAQCKRWLPMDHGRKPGQGPEKEQAQQASGLLLLNQ